MKQSMMRNGMAITLMLLLGACVGPKDDEGDADTVVIEERGEQGQEGMADGGAGDGGMTSSEGAKLSGEAGMAALDNPQSPLSNRVFYFEFDRHELAEADRQTLAAHAAHLASNPGLSVEVVGHADERGSREYNLALGERRAKVVASLLKLQGAARSQVQVISFGEERPVALDHDDAAWRLNRRAELLYSGN